MGSLLHLIFLKCADVRSFGHGSDASRQIVTLDVIAKPQTLSGYYAR